MIKIDLSPSPLTAQQSSAPATYEDIFPYYAELSALSELRKKPGFGVPISSGMGGHSLLYLNGVRVRRDASCYPVLEVCPVAEAGRHGAAISVNSHYRNANWVAFEGRDFAFRGVLRGGAQLTRETYEQTQIAARMRGVLDGIEFHEHVFKDKPAYMSREVYKYEISVATDYAVCFGRDAYRARVPLNAPRMQDVVNYLNALNQPYREGQKFYRWRLLNDNCTHVAHNALSAAGFWAPWHTGQRALVAAFKFPVPKNEMVDLAHRANDLPLEDPDTLLADESARTLLMAHGTLPSGPGALTSTAAVVTPNDVYDTKKLRLIFYDNPFWGTYRFQFKRLLSEPRYRELRANLHHFAGRYRAAERGIVGSRLPPELLEPYARHIATQAECLASWLQQWESLA